MSDEQRPMNKEQPTAKHWPLHLHTPGVWVVIGVVVLGLALISYLGLRHNTTTNTAHQSLAQVTVTGSGFSPAVLSVKPNTLVTWTNDDTNPHEVAADPYPKNNSIPNFDSTQVLQTNDSYSFNFQTKGTYTYHDQLNPLKLLGTVVVR